MTQPFKGDTIDLSMKREIIAFVCLFMALASLGQVLSGMELSFNKLDQDDSFIISSSMRFDYNNHTWSVGPALLYSFGDQVEEREKIKLTGLALGYEHYIHGKEKKWNLFHSFDFVAQRIKDVQASQYFDLNTNSFIPNEIEQIDKTLLLSANMGVLWRLNDQLSLSQTIGIGASAVFRKTESNIDSFDDIFFNQRWSLKTAIRYSLKR